MSNVHTTLYDTLHVSRKASVPEIKKAYRKLAKEFHPDKNPNAGDEFKDISYAHEVLTDPRKRSIYDQYGLSGLQKGHRPEPSFSNPGDVFFSNLYGRGSRTYASHETNCLQNNIIHPLKVTLEDLYNGKQTQIFVNRNVICVDCNGTGTKSRMQYVCVDCRGTGIRIQYTPLLFLPQQHTNCPTCTGAGYVIPTIDRCSTCLGKKICAERKRLDFFVEKGMTENKKIILYGEGDQTPGTIPGNIFVILQEIPHIVFKRVGNDLHVIKEISLTEALCGFSFVLTHLDGRNLNIVQPPGNCVKSDQIKGIYNEGMPLRSNPTERGNLYVKFKIKFPENYFANEVQLKEIENLLGPRPGFSMPTGENYEEVDLQEYDVNLNDTYFEHREAYNEDEDEQYFDGHSPLFGMPCTQS